MTKLEEAKINKDWAAKMLLDPGHLPQELSVKTLENLIVESVQTIAEKEPIVKEVKP